MSTFHNHSCHLRNAYFGARLGAKSFMCIIELYIYTHDYDSVNLRLVIVPPAGARSFQLSLWEHRLDKHKLNINSWVSLLPHVCYVGPPFSTFPTPGDRTLESQSWKTPLSSCKFMVFKLSSLVFLAQGLLARNDEQDCYGHSHPLKTTYLGQ